jgi:hypothetical protein
LGDGFAVASTIENAGTGTGFGSGPGEMAEAISRASGGDQILQGAMIARARSKAEQARRFDLSGGSFGAYITQVGNISRAEGAEGVQTAVQNAHIALTDSALDVSGPGAIVGGRGQSVENLIPAAQRRLQLATEAVDTARAGGNQERIQETERQAMQALASTAALHDVAGQVSPENGRILSDGLLNQAIPGRPGSTVMDQIEAHRGDEVFQQMRRELGRSYGSAEAERAAAAAAAAASAGGAGQIPPVGGIPGQ